MLSHPCFRWLIILHLLPWSIATSSALASDNGDAKNRPHHPHTHPSLSSFSSYAFPKMDFSTLYSTLSYLSETTSRIAHSVDYLNTVFSSIYHHYLSSYVVDASSGMGLGGLGGLLLSSDNNNAGALSSGYGHRGGYSYGCGGGGYIAVE